jgi:signal transduction histidine kinase
VPVVAASASGSSKNVEVEHGGRVFLFSIVPTPGENYVNVYGRDITAVREAERTLRRHSEELERLVSERAEKLLEVERLAAVGEIASAVGHDLRAPLQVLTSDLYLIKEKLASLPPESKKVRDELLQTMETMNLQLKYMSGIIYDLQALVGRARPQLSEADVSKLVDRTLMGMEVPPNVKIAVNVQAPAGATRANVDAVMIMRVFTNLITNAIQAMPNGGSLTITLSLKDKWLSIEFSDTGVGMSPETMRKLFTPLFTTKERGMGLGLAICKQIVEAHGGRISTRSKAGEGTTFTVELPLPSEGKQ